MNKMGKEFIKILENDHRFKDLDVDEKAAKMGMAADTYLRHRDNVPQLFAATTRTHQSNDSRTSLNEIPEKVMKSKIFISHSSKDSEIARWLANKLDESGADVWIDHNRLKAGSSIPDSINAALKSCNIFILLWSNSVVNSDWVNIEWTSALMDQKTKIIPILLDETPLPNILRRLYYIDFSNEKEKGLKQLLEAI
jgi:hypothetical protein